MVINSVSPISKPPLHTLAPSPKETQNTRYGSQTHRRTQAFSPKVDGSIQHPYKHRIIFASAVIILPMTSFTIAVIYVVFANSLGQTSSDCPFPELCPNTERLNKTAKANFYVDFSPGRLAFISSLSSTISFALISVMMAIYAYSTASWLLRYSEEGEDYINGDLPSPYQTSVLLRVLNAELLVLIEVGWSKMKRTFWAREKSENKKSTVPLVQRSILILLLCLLASIFIQVADTYFHISLASVPFVLIQSSNIEQHWYSRSLAPWCIDRQGVGSMNNKNFWSCSINYAAETSMVALANNSLVNDFVVGPWKDYALNYTDEEGVQYAIVGPPFPPKDVDWKASSFAISTVCPPMQRGACDFSGTLQEQNFTCTKERSGIDLVGRITAYTVQRQFLDIHKYMREGIPFGDESVEGYDSANKTAPHITDAEVDEVFRNPWHWVSVLAIPIDEDSMPEAFKNDTRVWPKHQGGLDHMWLLCNTTVWDVNYTAIDKRVTSLDKKKSNGTMAGIASLPLFRAFGFYNAEFSLALVAAATEESPDAFIGTYNREVSKIISHSLAAQTVAQTALLAQTRISKIVTQLPVSALWVLVAANIFFAVIGVGLAVLALFSASEAVHQVHTRLGVTGLVATLFEDSHAERAVKSDTDLFEEKLRGHAQRPKKVGVRRTTTGGSTFTLKNDN